MRQGGQIVLAICILLAHGVHPTVYPECRHGGKLQKTGGRVSCQCPRNRVNTGPLCEVVRINFRSLDTPLIALTSVSTTHPLHISFDVISADYRGTGIIFTLGDYKKGIVLEFSLTLGKPVVKLNGTSKQADVDSLNDNMWHRIDLFITKTPISIEALLIVDRGIGSHSSKKLIFDGFSSSSVISGPLTFSIKSPDGDSLNETCLENFVINSELVDFWNSTRNRPLARGCPKCEEACYFTHAINDTGRCGVEGVCRNPIIAATDKYSCTCRPGYQQASPVDYPTYTFNTSAPCVEKTPEWEINGPVTIQVPSIRNFTIIIGLRTRQRDTPILRSKRRFRLEIENGTLEFGIDTCSLTLPAVEITDGLWHTIQLSVTPILRETKLRMAEISVDGLFGSFYNSTIVSTDFAGSSNSDGEMVVDALASCLSDLRVEQRDKKNNVYHENLLSEYSQLEMGCESEDLCETSEPCGPNEICVPEWRGYSCICKPGYSVRFLSSSPKPVCVLASCDPNPCQNAGECLVLETETITYENDSVGVLCGCVGGWTGLFCERPPAMSSVLQNWWLIPFFFVLIAIILCAVFGICCWKKTKRNKKNVVTSITNAPQFVEQQERMIGRAVAKAGEEDYRGSLNLSALCTPSVPIRPGRLTVRGASIETRTADSMLSADGERFMAMDQPLQYAFEGYDSSPPPPTYFINNGSSSNRNGGSSYRFDFCKNTS